LTKKKRMNKNNELWDIVYNMPQYESPKEYVSFIFRYMERHTSDVKIERGERAEFFLPPKKRWFRDEICRLLKDKGYDGRHGGSGSITVFYGKDNING
jgi:hypothetical protein